MAEVVADEGMSLDYLTMLLVWAVAHDLTVCLRWQSSAHCYCRKRACCSEMMIAGGEVVHLGL